MNLSPLWEAFLFDKGFTAIHWSKVGSANDSDKTIFNYALANNFIIFTNDLDFGAILAATNSRFPSVFQLKSQELMPNLIGDLVINCLSKYSSELLDGVLFTFDVNKVRIRMLPIKN